MSQNENLSSESQGCHILPSYPCIALSDGTVKVVGDPTLMQMTPGGEVRPWKPAVMPEIVSPAGSRKKQRPTKKSRYSHSIRDILNDSGSDSDNDEKEKEEDFGGDFPDIEKTFSRDFVVKLRKNLISELEDMAELKDSKRMKNERGNGVNEASVSVVSESGQNEGSKRVNETTQAWGFTLAAPVDTDFVWSEDFTSFAGKKEVYSRVPGPNFSSQDPAHIFQQIWDPEFIAMVVKETNLYAWEVIAQFSDPDNGSGIPDYLESWTEVTVEELYRYLSILIYMSFCYRPKIQDYWNTGILGMPGFRNIMSRNRFLVIAKFLHFVSNADLSSRGYDRKIEKIAPVLDHCNRKFAALYTPSQHLSLDETLLLWQGKLNWKQCVRTKAARFGIKSFELCESETGYLLQFRLYTGKKVEKHPSTSHGLQGHSAKIVLELFDGFLDVGHVLVMDNWYNQLVLTRYLKTRRTDVLGTLNRRRQGLPTVIKDLDPKHVSRGATLSRHSGDISLVTWKDGKLVTVSSTFHQNSMIPIKRMGQTILKPLAVEDFNRYMGGVHLKDQKTSMFFMERKRGLKWYMKVFKKLLNTSLLNAYIMYTKNPMYQMSSHRDFRFRVAEGLLRRYPLVCPDPPKVLNKSQLHCSRLQPGRHFPIYTEPLSGSRNGNKRLRCVRCCALKKRVTVRTLCELCKVPLCLAKCWKDYHTLLDLKKIEEDDGRKK